jgi:hypothetical protein
LSAAARVTGEPERVWLPMLSGEPLPMGAKRKAAPVAGPSDLRVREAYRIQVRTDDPPGDWMTYVDAATGELLWRYNRVRFAAASGTVTGDVHPAVGTDTPVSVPFPNENLFGGITTATVVSYNFEAGAAGWTGQAPWALSGESVHGGTRAWSDSPGVQYLDNIDVSLTSPTINIAATADPVLEFWVRTDLEDTYDYVYVEASSDNGATWKRLHGMTGVTAFHLESVDLAAVEASATLKVRFRLVSDGGVTGDGCWVDDVVIASRGSGITNASGAYTLNTTGGNNNVTTGFRGRWVEVSNIAGAEASQTVLATGGVANFNWTNANSAAGERDMYQAVNTVHSWLKQVDPTNTTLDYPLPIHVNQAALCNAFWNGAAVVVGSGTPPSCLDLGTWQPVMYHEYGHGITDFIYEPVGDPPGDMHEAFSDYTASTITGDPRVGPGILGPESMFRTIENNWRDPEDRAGEVHMDGTIIAAALWDMRGLLAPDVALSDHLFHFARYGFPYSFDDYFLEVLTVDDNDANLGNGTPHITAIRSAFGYHGIGYGPEFKHLGVTVQDAGQGNGDGRLDPGESTNLLLSLRNYGGAETGVWAKLRSTTPGVTVTADSVFVGNVGAGAEITLPAAFAVTVGAGVTVGTAVVFDFEVHSSVGFNTDNFMLPVGYVPILLVDDDRSRVYEPYYQDSLTRLGKKYTRWEAAVLGSPTAEEMAKYCAVIWFAGVDAVTTIAPGDQAELAQYLGAGGRLFVTGNNIAEDLWAGSSSGTPSAADKAFYETWLHATVNQANEGTTPPAVNGVAADPIGNGLALSLTGGTGASNQSSASSLFLRPGAVSAFTYSNGRIAALRYDGAHRVFHCGFGFEGISTAANRDSVMGRALRWLCPGEAVAPAVQVVQPNGGETLVSQQSYTIRWTANDATAVLSVNLLLSTDGGANYTPIVTGTPNDFSYDWTVPNLSSNQCRIRVQAVDPSNNTGTDISDQNFTITNSTDVVPGTPRTWALHPAVPNPFNPSTRLQFDLPQAAAVRLEVLGVDGRKLRTLLAGVEYPAGAHAAQWDGRDDHGRPLASGVYVVRMQAGDYVATRKVQLLK